MKELFPIENVVNREKFPGGPNQDPGVRLSWGYLPGRVFGDVAYVHIAELQDDGQIIPSSKDAVCPDTGEIREEGEIVTVDMTAEPPEIIRSVGSFAVPPSGLSSSDKLVYIPKLLGQ